MGHGGVVYILTNKNNTTLYVGVTSDLTSRLMEHIHKEYQKSFSSKYNLNKLVYYEVFGSIEEAISREKRFKKGTRAYKEKCINSMNPDWTDLGEEVLKW